MNIIATLFIVIGILFIGNIGLIIFKAIDWQAIFVRKYGNNYKKGLAHILLGDVWIYRESSLYFVGDDAMSYSRVTNINGKDEITEDIVPNAIGFDYDEYTGARVYRIQPGGTIATSDRSDGPKVDYPARLISVHTLDRTVANYASSVNDEEPFNWKPVIIGVVTILVIAIIAGTLIATGVIKLPGVQPQQTTESQTEAAPDDNEITEPVEVK